MTANELDFLKAGPKVYEEPDESALTRLSHETWKAVRPLQSHRIKIIEKAGVVLEPLQEGVISYPPILVRPDEIAADLSRPTP